MLESEEADDLGPVTESVTGVKKSGKLTDLAAISQKQIPTLSRTPTTCKNFLIKSSASLPKVNTKDIATGKASIGKVVKLRRGY